MGQLHTDGAALIIDPRAEPTAEPANDGPPDESDDSDDDNSIEADDDEDVDIDVDEESNAHSENENEEEDSATLLETDTVSAEPERISAHADESGGPATRTRSGRQRAGRNDFYEMNNHAYGTCSKTKECVGECITRRPEPQLEDDYIIGDVFLNYALKQKQDCCYTQMSLSKGLEAFGERAEDAVMSEFLQFHRMDVLRPPHVCKHAHRHRKRRGYPPHHDNQR